MSWNYRVIRHRRRKTKKLDGETWYAVHEVYYDKKLRPYMVSKEPDGPQGDSVKEILSTLVRMMNDVLRHEVIDMAYFNKLVKNAMKAAEKTAPASSRKGRR